MVMAVYKQPLLYLAIIFIVAGALLYFLPIPTPPYVAIVVLAIGIAFLVIWAILLAVHEIRH